MLPRKLDNITKKKKAEISLSIYGIFCQVYAEYLNVFIGSYVNLQLRKREKDMT